ncbi:MAG: circadian clock protein KaiC [Methanobacteriales archaeon]|nr:circadian clock protein KaiC [Methanobacteriales archaeon]
MRESPRPVDKTPTGIWGVDIITRGGLPRGRNTLVFGGPGTGKTFFAMEFLVNGASVYDEPGVMVSFEESEDNIIENFRSDDLLRELIRENKIFIEDFSSTKDFESGDYSLEALFMRLDRLDDAIKRVGAKRIVLDKIDNLFSHFEKKAIIRSELLQLIEWLNSRGLTSVFTTGENPYGGAAHGLEEYVSDCVIHLKHRYKDHIGTRYMTIKKYRGSEHGLNEYPMLINSKGLSLFPITSLRLDYTVSRRIVSSGIPELDNILGGGFYQWSSVLISGTSGTGKTSFVAKFAYEACERGERCLLFANEEPADQIIRNMASVGIDLEKFSSHNLLIHSERPTTLGLEAHLTAMQDLVREFEPDHVIIDPISSLTEAGFGVKDLFVRFTDFLKNRKITSILTYLTEGGSPLTTTEIHLSSLIDTWVILQQVEKGGYYANILRVLKSRGLKHSKKPVEFKLTSKGIKILGGE